MSISLEDLVRLYNIVESPIAAWDLDTGMVLRFGGKLRVLISVAYENTDSGPVAFSKARPELKGAQVIHSSRYGTWTASRS